MNLILLKNVVVIPELFLGISIIYLLLFGAIVSTYKTYPLIQKIILKLAILILFFSTYLIFNDQLLFNGDVFFNNTIICDFLSFSSKLLISLFSLICVIMIKYYIIDQKINQFEYLIVILIAVLGFLILCSANDLITAYLAIELQSLAFYIMAAFKKNSSFSVEAGLKYFILGSFSSALLLFGSSLIYGSTGSLNFTDLKLVFGHENTCVSLTEDWCLIMVFDILFRMSFSDILKLGNAPSIDALQVGLLFLTVSLFFKLAVAPLHAWSPDIYENSPTSSTIFFVVVSKLGILVLLTRVFISTFASYIEYWNDYVVILAVISVIIGSITALEQKKIKSLLAYSSISHIGYMLISFSSGTKEGLQSLYAYIIVYMLAGLCIWSIFLILRLKSFYFQKQNKDLGDLTLLFKSNSIIAICFSIVLLSIAGFPPLIGFLTKMGIFLAAVESSMYYVAIISILASVISTFYYIRIIKILFFEKFLVGNLYYPLDYVQTIVVVTSFFLFVYLFINPTFLYLISYKISLLI